MKVFVTGTRGIPHIMGGVEKHCEELYPLLTEMGVNVSLARRSCYIQEADQKIKTYRGIELFDIFAPKKKSLEAIVHTFLAVLAAKKNGCELVHCHAVGPSIMIPFARLLGLKVVMTHHGPDYDRQKWGRLAKSFLRFGEWCAARFANEIIVISETINTILATKYKRTGTHLIYNGVKIPQKAESSHFIDELGLVAGKYIIAVCRFVPEKGLHDLVEAYSEMVTDYTLVLVGDADHETEYSRDIKQKALEDGAVLTGFITGDKLHQIFSHAGLFVMPSYHEGLPIALLEALSYGLNVVVSDIAANKEVDLPQPCYFKTGDVKALAGTMLQQLDRPQPFDQVAMVREKYNWETIAKQTLAVYERLLNS